MIKNLMENVNVDDLKLLSQLNFHLRNISLSKIQEKISKYNSITQSCFL